MAVKNSNKKIGGLNGLRTLGLLGVILYHTFPQQIPGGFFGVIIFFVISGFLSGFSIHGQMQENSFHLLQYYKKRLLRIYPALFIVLFCTVGAVLFLQPVKLANTQEEVVSILLNYNNYWQITKNADYFANLAQNSPFTHMWYMSILLQFELVCPLFCAFYHFLRKHAGRDFTMFLFLVLCFGMGLVMPVLAFQGKVSLTELYYRTDCRIFSLLIGLFGGILYSEDLKIRIPGTRKKAGTNFWVFGSILLSIVLFLFAKGTYLWVYQFGMLLYSFLVLILISLVNKQRFARIFDNPVTNYLSRYSFEIYLWQYPVLFLAIVLGYTGIWYFYIAQFAVILILSIWTNTFVRRLVK